MTDANFAANAIIPSRNSNPFATCWTRPGALPFRFPTGTSAQRLIAQLQTLNWHAAIIGPHGSGKSSLLETLKPQLADAGHQIVAITLRDGQRRLPRSFLYSLSATVANRCCQPALAIIDGYEQLGWLERWRLARRCRHARCGLLITAHATTLLPTLIELTPDAALVAQLVGDLCREVSNSITPQIVAASHACHGSNVREIFFDLYDRYELARRTC